MTITTEQLREESLEQVAAYVGYRSWREFCAMQDGLAEALSLLRAMEGDVCPACGGFDRIHKPDCRLAALLAKHKETK